MPTLLRLLVLLLFLGGIVLAGMIALTTFVEPQEREITQRIPTRDFMQGG